MANAYLPELDGYGDAALPLDRLKRRRIVVQIRHTEGEWPEFERRHVCQDATGRWREKHSYVVEGPKGTTCCYCGRLRPGPGSGLLRVRTE